MLEVDRVWQRVSQRPEMRDKKLNMFGYQGVVTRYNGLTTLAIVENQKANFPNGAVILGITGGAQVEGQAATVSDRDGLDMFALSFDFQQNRSIVGQTRTIASSVFGTGKFNQFPPYELVIPTNGFLMYGFENLTTSTIDLFITHHCLVPVNVG